MTVTLTWDAPAAGEAPTSYVIAVGSQSGGADEAIVATESAARTFSAPVPNGTFYLRMYATNTAGTSGPSNEVAVIAGLQAPVGLIVLVNGSTVTLFWRAPPNGQPSTYIIEVGTSRGSSD